MAKLAFITGVTRGIGRAIAEIYAKNGFRLILNARRENLLQELQEELSQKYGTVSYLIPFDVRDRDLVKESIEALPEDWQDIDVLINNAGLAKGFHDIHEAKIDDWETMIDTNIKGLLFVSRAIMPMMVERKTGHILNIGSIAGKEVYAKGNVYCSTKHAVEGITKAMRMDLLPHKIKVSAVCPGAVNTDFSKVRFDGDEERAEQVYDGYQPLLAEDIAEAVYFVTSRPFHVNINDLLIMPTAQANTSNLLRETD
jgi:NADP-dependent 3-hydroxy acid dehydrogenase YdfG